MDNIKNILFPVDFSPSNKAMAAYVQRASTLMDAAVTLLHVVDQSELGLTEQLELVIRPQVEILQDHEAVRADMLKAFLTHELPNASRILHTGDPAAVIAQFVRDNDIDLIVMPTHSGRFRQLLLGSTTARVISDSACPVLTSRHAETTAPRPLSHRRWVIALPAHQYAKTIVHTVAAIAQQAGADLSFIHAVEDNCPSGEEYLKEVIKQSGLDVPLRSIVGSPQKTLLAAVDDSGADVLIIGRCPTSPHERMTDLTYTLVRDSSFPVVSI